MFRGIAGASLAGVTFSFDYRLRSVDEVESDERCSFGLLVRVGYSRCLLGHYGVYVCVCVYSLVWFQR